MLPHKIYNQQILKTKILKYVLYQGTLEEILVPRVPVDGGRKPHIVRYLLKKGLKPYIEYRHSMFERVYPINEKLARRMLQTGYKQPSKFGRWCPVKVFEENFFKQIAYFREEYCKWLHLTLLRLICLCCKYIKLGCVGD